MNDLETPTAFEFYQCDALRTVWRVLDGRAEANNGRGRQESLWTADEIASMGFFRRLSDEDARRAVRALKSR